MSSDFDHERLSELEQITRELEPGSRAQLEGLTRWCKGGSGDVPHSERVLAHLRANYAHWLFGERTPVAVCSAWLSGESLTALDMLVEVCEREMFSLWSVCLSALSSQRPSPHFSIDGLTEKRFEQHIDWFVERISLEHSVRDSLMDARAKVFYHTSTASELRQKQGGATRHAISATYPVYPGVVPPLPLHDFVPVKGLPALDGFRLGLSDGQGQRLIVSAPFVRSAARVLALLEVLWVWSAPDYRLTVGVNARTLPHPTYLVRQLLVDYGKSRSRISR